MQVRFPATPRLEVLGLSPQSLEMILQQLQASTLQAQLNRLRLGLAARLKQKLRLEYRREFQRELLQLVEEDDSWSLVEAAQTLSVERGSVRLESSPSLILLAAPEFGPVSHDWPHLTVHFVGAELGRSE